MDPLTGEDLPDGKPGEICTRGLLMKGYFQNPEATARVIDREGWYHTGDLGTRDAQGYFRITGRLKDVIVKEGKELLPTEIEDVVYTLPGVAMVQAFGVPDPVQGERVAVWVKAQRGGALDRRNGPDPLPGTSSRTALSGLYPSGGLISP